MIGKKKSTTRNLAHASVNRPDPFLENKEHFVAGAGACETLGTAFT